MDDVERSFKVFIRNRDSLIEAGATPKDRHARRLIIHGLEAALDAVNPEKLARKQIKYRHRYLSIADSNFRLAAKNRIILIGIGKASIPMAFAIQGVMGSTITDGVIIVPEGYMPKKALRGPVIFHEAGHPIPNEASLEGAQMILQMLNRLKNNDLVICLISGGGSALMAMPSEGISLQDKRETTELLMRSGATIHEVNIVRKHLSSIKGGWLARKIYPAKLLTLVLSDVVGDSLDTIASGPTVPDPSTFQDAVQIMKRYDVWDKVPEATRRLLKAGLIGRILETPKPYDPYFRKARAFIIGNNMTAAKGAAGLLKRSKVRTMILTTSIEGEARIVGRILGSIAQEIHATQRQIQTPTGIILGGETTVTLRGRGRGGRNQEVSLGSVEKIAGLKGVAVASMGTDGVDGISEAAGAIADETTLSRARRLGLDPAGSLSQNDSYNFFTRISDCILTGPTGTNVGDIMILVSV